MSIINIKNKIFEIIASIFPTQYTDKSKLINFVWRLLFYSFRPEKPFKFKTRYYEMIAYPDKYHLSRSVIRRGYWEIEETELFVKHLNKGMFVIDGGANFGHYSMVASNIVGPEGLIYAFEPVPNLYKDLIENIAMCNYENCKTFNCALGNKNEKTQFTLDDKNPGGHSLVTDNTLKPGKIIEINMMTMDELLEKSNLNRPLGLLKLDTQGGEGIIFEGAINTIRNDRPIIFTEFWPGGIRGTNQDPGYWLDFFYSLDYKISIIHKHKINNNFVSKEEIFRYIGPEFSSFANLRLVPS